MIHLRAVALVCVIAGSGWAGGGSHHTLDRVPLHFESLPGPAARYLAHAGGYSLQVAGGEAVLATAGVAVRLEWVGSNRGAVVAPEGRLPGRSHYFIGNDPAGWRRGVPHYRRVRVSSVYPGIDLVYYGHGRQVEFDVVVSPGADLNDVRLRFSGEGAVDIDGTGDLVLEIAGGSFRQRKPAVHQTVDGERVEIAGRYVRCGERDFCFDVADYDHARTLVVDPVLVYSSYIGGGSLDAVRSVAVDEQGNIYVTGETQSANFPRQGYQKPPASPLQPGDVFVTKLAPDGKSIRWSVVIGGSQTDYGNDVFVSGDGTCHVTGFTDSADFPTAGDPAQPDPGRDHGAWGDAFVFRLNASGDRLLYATYFGGRARDSAHAITIGPGGDIFIVGETNSKDLPTTAGAFQETAPAALNGFVARLRNVGPGVVYATYLGGRNNDAIHDIAVDSKGLAYVTGMTLSPDFPTTTNVVQPEFTEGDQFVWKEAFVTRLKADGSGVAQSTFLGGSRDDAGRAIAIDSYGAVYVAGETSSTDFPTTAGAYQTANADSGSAFEGFVTKIEPKLSRLAWSSYLGGSRTDRATALALSSAGMVTVAGETESSNFPTMDGSCELSLHRGGRDAFVARFATGGASLVYSAYLGGIADDRAGGVAIDAAGNAYVGGETASPDFPVTAGAQRESMAFVDGFLAKLGAAPVVENTCISAPGVLNAASFRPGAVSPGELVTIFGKGIGPPDLIFATVNENNRFNTATGGTQVFFDGVAAPMIYTYQTQVSAIVPYGVDARATTRVRVQYKAESTNTVELVVAESAPGIFSMDASGQGQGAVLLPDFSGNGPHNPVDRGGILILFVTGEGQTAPRGEDGKLAIDVYPKPVLPVSVRIGGVPADVEYYGAAPGLVAGVMQVNVVVPKSVEPGDEVPLILKVGDRTSQPGITVAVR